VTVNTRPRPPIPKTLQVEVFRRDGWLCRWCLRPVVFPPALKLLEQWIRDQGVTGPLAYFHPNWRRDAAPLLDELGASVDHVEAHALGGSSEINNLATICAKCNARKGNLAAEEHLRRNPMKKVKGKHGEPLHWDGLASLFMLLAGKHSDTITLTDKQWLAALSVAQKGPET
jgi:5-methylcytosine-specific restriction endonuclease McrA